MHVYYSTNTVNEEGVFELPHVHMHTAGLNNQFVHQCMSSIMQNVWSQEHMQGWKFVSGNHNKKKISFLLYT